MKISRLVLGTTLTMGLIVGAFAKEEAAALSIGSPAPKLNVSAWAKGTPVKGFDNGQVYVVEFWATWCGPCKTSIPHITEMAKKFGSKVNFIGVSVWERGDDIPGMVKKFVDEMGAKMDYNIALDNGDAMAETWMTAARQNGIPAAFIVNQKGQIAWIGHPMDNMDKTLEKVVDGKYDMKSAKAKFDAEIAAEAKMQEAMAKVSAATKLYNSGKTAEAEAAWAKTEQDHPELSVNVMMAKMQTYAVKRPVRAKIMATTVIRSGDEAKIGAMASFAQGQVRRNPKDTRLATYIADEISKLTLKDPYVYYMIAEVAAQSGKKTTAVERISKGIAMLENDKDAPEDFKKFMNDALARYNKMAGQP